ncbi:MAG: exonuclease SbcCD subunit D [Alloprevotella sp.]|nr:exonuclease SbcCD subunit D [Alloprevotella sp.]
MKLLHTADWHLGNTFHGYSREEEHAHFLGWLLGELVQRQPDVLFVAGDIFDSPNPSATAEGMFFNFLHDATQAVAGLQIVIVAGNHDSGGRLEAPEALLKAHNVYVRGTVRRTETDEPDYDYYILPLSRRDTTEAEIVTFAVPYLRSGDYPAGMSQEEGLKHFFAQLYKRLKKSDFAGLPVFVCAHYYADGAQINTAEHSERLVVGGQDRVDDASWRKGASYVALGHIHKAQQSAANAYYAGSALPLSFSEKSYKHGVRWIETDESGAITSTFVEYTPLRGLISIPDKGAARPADVLGELSDLPERKRDDDGRTWPYLEIRVREEQPEPELLHDVTAVLQSRAAHFCRMVRETDEKNGQQGVTEAVETLNTLSPQEMAERVFRQRFGENMPDELKGRFEQAVEAVMKDA